MYAGDNTLMLYTPNILQQAIFRANMFLRHVYADDITLILTLFTHLKTQNSICQW